MIQLSDTPHLNVELDGSQPAVGVELHTSNGIQSFAELNAVMACFVKNLPMFFKVFFPLLPASREQAKTQKHWIKGFKGKLNLSVTLVDEAEIKQLNQKYRNKNAATDVLSFPTLSEFLSYGLPITQLGEAVDLGDIYICLPYLLKEICRNKNITPSQQQQVFINSVFERFCHGCLHLLGVHHDTMPDYNQVKQVQGKVLQKLGMTVL